MEKNILRFKWIFVLMIVSLLCFGVVSAGPEPTDVLVKKIPNEPHYLIRNTEIEIEQGVVVKASKKETNVILGNEVSTSDLDCFVQITGNEKTRHVKLKENEFDIKYDSNNPSVFVLDENCELGEGTKFVTQKGNYNLRGYEAALPEDSDVNYEKEKVVASVVSGTKVTPPIVRDRSKVRGTFEIKTKDAGALLTSGGKFQAVEKITEGENAGKYKSKQTSIFYTYENNNLKTYSEEAVAVFLNNNNQVDFAVFNSNARKENPKFYLLFEMPTDNRFPSDANYLLVTDKEIASISPNEGVVINLGPGNRLGVGGNYPLEPNKRTLSFQGKTGVALLQKSDNQREIPFLTISGNSIYDPDKKSFFLNNGKLYYADYPTIALGNHGDSTPYLRLVVKGNKENPFGFEIFTNNQNQHVAVKKGALKSSLQYFQGGKGSIVSNTVVFNELSPEARKIFVGLSEEEQNRLIQGGISSEEVVTTDGTSRGANPTTTRRNGGGAGLETRLRNVRTGGGGAEGGIYEQINNYRISERKGELVRNNALDKIARDYSVQMAKLGMGLTTGLKHSSNSGRYYGENIAMFGSGKELNSQQVATEFSTMWWNSRGYNDQNGRFHEGHYQNLLRNHYTQTGVGVYHYVGRNGMHYYYSSQVFK